MPARCGRVVGRPGCQRNSTGWSAAAIPANRRDLRRYATRSGATCRYAGRLSTKSVDSDRKWAGWEPLRSAVKRPNCSSASGRTRPPTRCCSTRTFASNITSPKIARPFGTSFVGVTTRALSKAVVTELAGAADGLSSERSYVSRVLPTAIARELTSMTSDGLARASVICLGLAVTHDWLRSGQGQPPPVQERNVSRD